MNIFFFKLEITQHDVNRIKLTTIIQKIWRHYINSKNYFEKNILHLCNNENDLFEKFLKISSLQKIKLLTFEKFFDKIIEFYNLHHAKINLFSG